MLNRLVSRLLSVIMTVGLGAAWAHAADSATPESLIALVQKGGYVIYFRHEQTMWNQEGLEEKNRASGVFSFDDCTTQRNLSPEGKARAQAVGEAFGRLSIPVGRVISSRYCRTQDHAEAAFGQRGEPVFPGASSGDKAQQSKALRALINDVPAKGNTVFVAHYDLFQATFGFGLEEGEAAVFEPVANGEPRALGRVGPEAWTQASQSK